MQRGETYARRGSFAACEPRGESAEPRHRALGRITIRRVVARFQSRSRIDVTRRGTSGYLLSGAGGGATCFSSPISRWSADVYYRAQLSPALSASVLSLGVGLTTRTRATSPLSLTLFRPKLHIHIDRCEGNGRAPSVSLVCLARVTKHKPSFTWPVISHYIGRIARDALGDRRY